MWYHIFLEKFHRQEDCITAKASPTIILEFISWYNVWCQLPLNTMWSWKTRKTVDVDCPRSEASPITWDFPTLPTHFYKNVGATISPPIHRHELLQGLVFCLCRCEFFWVLLLKWNFDEKKLSFSASGFNVPGFSSNQRVPNSCSTLTGGTCVFPFIYNGVTHFQVAHSYAIFFCPLDLEI